MQHALNKGRSLNRYTHRILPTLRLRNHVRQCRNRRWTSAAYESSAIASVRWTHSSAGSSARDQDLATSKLHIQERMKTVVGSRIDDSKGQPASQTGVQRIYRTGEPRPKRYPHHFRVTGTAKKQSGMDLKSLALEQKQIEELSLNTLYDLLHELAAAAHLDKTYDLARGLIQYRLEPPSRRLYHALILANASSEGSVDRVIHLLKELKDEGIALDQTLCNAVLRVLAVHPDHILRIEILQHMERRWLGLSAETHHLVIASLFRALQLEHGVHEMQMMRQNNLQIEEWLYALAISVLVEVGELDEAMKVMRLRVEQVGNDETTALWTNLLDSAAEAHHHVLSRYIWLRCVKAEYITVSSGTCLQLLVVAARKGDVKFALDITRVIKRYHGRLTLHHWELLVETYSSASQLEQALKTVVEMEMNEIQPEHFTTRPIYSALQAMPEDRRDDLCLELYDYLLNRHSMAGRLVPIAAVNVLLESCTQAQSAYDMYQSIRLVCRNGPDANTFHYLLAFTARQGDAKRALQFAREYSLIKPNPSLAVYDGLLLSLIEGDHTMPEILKIYDEMRATSRYPIFRTMALLYIALRKQRHDRAPEVFAHIQAMEPHGYTGELPIRLQKLRMEAAAEASKLRVNTTTRHQYLTWPPHTDSRLQGYVEDLQQGLKQTEEPKNAEGGQKREHYNWKRLRLFPQKSEQTSGVT